MTAIAAHKLQIIRTLVQTAPDAALRSLELALSGVGEVGGLAQVRGLVEVETTERFVRNNVLAPIVPLCGPRKDGLIHFPPVVLARLWKALKTVAPRAVEDAASRCNPWDLEQGAPEVFDQLCAMAVTGLRDPSQTAFDSLRDLSECEQLARCLEISSIVRTTLPKLSDWVSKMSGERAAAARLAYRDACAIRDDAGPMLFDMMAAQLPDEWRILRIISAVMDRPNDRYMASSEAASFGESVLTDIETSIAMIRDFDLERGEKIGREAGHIAQRVALQIIELEQSVNLAKDGPWGKRVAKFKQAIAQAADIRMAAADRELAEALPTRPISILGGKGGKGVALLDNPPDERRVRRATAALTFIAELRPCADKSGYGTTRIKALEKLNTRLDQYIEDVLYAARTGEGGDPAIARQYLDIAANLIAYTRDDKTAEIVRRRAAAAIAA
ncbi:MULTISPECIES: hypothetical protein [unclassified Caulobacter]|uniref:hypothetical protein n=1 Tax=unclassified Caulobacter TaxID=2648921 RepID=UPI000D3AB181|nr:MULTISPECIES: hypothetical protein [unclassified Caulobacter]PTS87458.1 hypothetical protein DBR21_12475 [Caulobacter sp. HMWF009]PTT05000.1 hypothetical protein DBR10_17175 [Caulobacter sp. HMWF025]